MTSAATSLRPQVLALYRRLIRLSKTWNSQGVDQTVVERDYIRDETRKLFKANASLTEEKDISDRILEAEARLTMAEHYRNPYPRPVNLPPRSYTKREGKTTGKAIKKLNEMSKPIYVKSIDDSVNQT